MSAPMRISPGREIALLDEDALILIEPEWAELWQRCRASPFQHPAWLLPWARRYAPGRCAAVGLRIGGRLEGIVPVFAWDGALRLAGTGPSDRGDWLLAPGAEAHSGALLAAIAEAPVGTYDCIDLRQLPPGSSFVAASAPSGWRDEIGDDEPCLVAPLLGEDGLGAASKKCRENWRYAMRRIAREGVVVELTPEAEVAGAIDDLCRLHALRWRERGQSGVLADPLLGSLLRDTAPRLARAGLLRLWRLRVGGGTIAVLLLLAGHRAHQYYIGGFDPAHRALSPSAVLVGSAMAQARSEGAAEFDFLRGAEPYKARWGAEPDPTRRRILVRTKSKLGAGEKAQAYQ